LPTWRLVRADRCFRAKSFRSAGLHFCFFPFQVLNLPRVSH